MIRLVRKNKLSRGTWLAPLALGVAGLPTDRRQGRPPQSGAQTNREVPQSLALRSGDALQRATAGGHPTRSGDALIPKHGLEAGPQSPFRADDS
jgi:hypothetical protein